MNRIKGTLETRVTPELLRRVTERYCKEHRRREAARRIASNLDAFVKKTHQELLSNDFSVSPGTPRTIGGRGEKVRNIIIPTCRDAILTAALFESIEKDWYARVYQDTYCNRKGYGGTRLFKRLRRFILEKKPKYAIKCDIRKCFDSIRHADVLSLLERRIKCKRLRQRIATVLFIKAGENARGLPIGNGISHHIANAILSEVYAKARALPGVTRLIAYMDDFILLGSNKRKLHAARRKTAALFSLIGLELKPNWQLYSIAKEGIDIAGYRLFADGRVRLRRKIFYRARRAKNPLRKASYYGFAIHARDKALIKTLSARKEQL